MSKKDKDKSKRKSRRRVRKRRRAMADSMPAELLRLQAQATKQTHSHVEQVFSRLCKHDPLDLLATIGALQLVPENAGRAVRLQAYAHVVTCSQVQANRPPISYEELKRLLDEDPIGAMLAYLEDPVEHLFTHEMTFVGGGHIVFPGINASAPFVVNSVCKALFFHPAGFPDRRFRTWAKGFIGFMLSVSNRVARRAALARGIEPRSEPGDGIVLPDPERLRRLKQAVRFTRADLSVRLRQLGLSASTLDQVCVQMGATELDSQAMGVNPLSGRAMVQMGRDVICAVPGGILSAIIQDVAGSAVQAGLREDFCRTYADAVWSTVVESLDYLAHRVQPAPPLPPLRIPHGREGVFTLDSDKLLYAVLVTDPLADFEPGDPNDIFQMQGLIMEIERRMPDVARSILQGSAGVNDLLCMIIIGGFARDAIAGLTEAGWEEIPKLCLSAEDLAFIAYAQGGKPLELWDFAYDLTALHKQCTVLQTSHLDMFEFYRNRGHTFYATDAARPTHILFPPGMGGQLRRRVLKERDLHAAPAYEGRAFAEVTSLHSGSEVPIYCVLSDIGRRAALLVEGLPLPVWVMGPEYSASNAPDERGTYAQLVDAVAYWVWQFTDSIGAPLKVIAESHDMLRILVEVIAADQWRNVSDPSPAATLAVVVADRNRGDLRVSVQPALSGSVAGPDNAGERALMVEILRGLRLFLPAQQRELLSEEAISACVEKHAPLGPKKKFFTLNMSENPQLCPVSFSYRKLSEAAENRVLDEMGHYLSVEKGVKQGRLGDAKHQDTIIKDVVSWLYGRLQRNVATLAPEALLEWLISHHEAIVHEAAENRLHTTTTPACFGNEQRMLERLVERLPEFANARLANRLLIEYVAAKPPCGLRPISLTAHDELLAISSAIINLGSMSDLLHYEIADLEYEVLPSGRLGRNTRAFGGPRDLYMQQYAFGQLARAKRSFGRFWMESSDANRSSQEGESPMDCATRAEWGVPLSDILDLLVASVSLSLEDGRGAVCWPEKEIVAELGAQLGWPQGKLVHILELLTLRARADFLTPPAPYGREEVYPWRLDRELSYVRRPFVKREAAGKAELLCGFRHMHRACEYLAYWVTSGRMRGKSEEVIALNTQVNAQRGRSFNQAVGKVLEALPGLVVRRRVKKIGKLPLPGDIDVLVFDLGRKRIFVIECKDLMAGRTPHELHTELLKLFSGAGGKKSLVEKHLARVTWVQSHLQATLASVGLQGESGWQVEDMIVTDSEMLSPFLQECPARIVPFEQIRQRGLSGCPGGG